jgi:tetratricopeptide (TPR) repeat protein
MNRQQPPFGRLPHIDLLHGARRIWKLRFENCRLTHLERQVFGFEREGDLPGELIPYVYFEYLRSGEAHRLVPIFHHNAIDILTLGCLTALVPAAFRAADSTSLAGLGFRKGEEYLGIGRWSVAAGDLQRGLELLNCAVNAGLPDALLFRTLWDIAVLEKRMERVPEALRIFQELASAKNAHQADALIELSKYYEHTERQFALALDFAQKAAELSISAQSERRIVRLKTKMTRSRSRRLL